MEFFPKPFCIHHNRYMENCTSVTVCDNKIKENGDLNSSHVECLWYFVYTEIEKRFYEMLRRESKEKEKEGKKEKCSPFLPHSTQSVLGNISSIFISK